MAKGLLVLRGALVALLVAPFLVVMSPVVASQALPGAAVVCDTTYVLQSAPPTQGGAVSIFKMDLAATTLTADTSFTPINPLDSFDGLAVDPVRNVFWAVSALLTGEPASIQRISPVDNSVRAFAGDVLRFSASTPTTRSNLRVGALDLTSNIYYYGYIEDSTLHLYGFRVDTQTAIRGEIATIDLTLAPPAGRLFGDITFDSNGNLYISVNGLIAKTTRLPVVGSTTPPTITATRLFTYPTTATTHRFLGISFAPDGLLYLTATSGASGNSFNYTFDESLGELTALDALTPAGLQINDAASCLSATVPGSFPVPPVEPLPAYPVVNSGWDVFPDDPGAGSSVLGAFQRGREPYPIVHTNFFGYFPDGNRAALTTSGTVGTVDASVLGRDYRSRLPVNGMWTLNDEWLTPAVRLIHAGGGCPVSGLCNGPAAGSFTIEFDQPVENLSLHLSGISGYSGLYERDATTSTGYSATRFQDLSTFTDVLTTDREVRVASSANGPKSLEVTPGPNGTYAVGIPDGIVSLECTQFENQPYSTQVLPTQYAGCGTLLIPGVVKSITFSANLKFTLGLGSGFVSDNAADEFGLVLSYERLAAVSTPVPTPTPTPEPLSVPSTVPSAPLTVPSVRSTVPSTVPVATAALAATGSSSPVWWAAAAAGLWLVVGTVLTRRRRAARSNSR